MRKPQVPYVAGERHHMLESVRYDSGKGGNVFWLFKCDCGKEKLIRFNGVRTGKAKSCGCAKGRLQIESKGSHGLCYSKEHGVWATMWSRCTNPKVKNYGSYGGRGITVSDEWKSFDKFYADMGPRPSPKHSIDRRDNNAGYSKENCRWVLRPVQDINRRNNVWLTAGIATLTISQWTKERGFRKGLIAKRLMMGWSHEKAVFTPWKRNPRRVIAA